MVKAAELSDSDITVIPGVEVTHVPPSKMDKVIADARRFGAKWVVVHGETISEPVQAGTNRQAAMNPDEGSYTCKLFNNETKMCKKVVEEATEYILAIKDRDIDEEAGELADLIYHAMVAAEKSGLPMSKVYEKLSERH